MRQSEGLILLFAYLLEIEKSAQSNLGTLF